MNTHFTVSADSDIGDEFDDPNSCDDDGSRDSDEIDSDIEFHLYSQIHYSSNVNDFDDGGEKSAQGLGGDDNQKLESVNEIKNESIRDNSVGDSLQSPTKVDAKPITKVSKPNRTKKGSFDKADIAKLKDYLSETSEDGTDFVPESWEIVDSVDESDSDDGGLDIHVSAKPDGEETEEDPNEAWIPGKGPDSCWKIDERDKKLFAADSRGRYYANETSKARCHNCDKTGHKARDCPAEKKQICCFMCGVRGHIGRLCPERENQKWSRRNIECNRCRQEGHMHSECPDLWRQFHLTIDAGPINLPKIPVKLNDKVQCYNCASEEHFGHECDEPRYQLYAPLLRPLVHRYDKRAIVALPQDLRKRIARNESRDRESPDQRHPHHQGARSRTERGLKNNKSVNKHIIFRSPTPEEKVQGKQNRKRKPGNDDNEPSLQGQRPVKKKRDEYEPQGRGSHLSKPQSPTPERKGKQKQKRKRKLCTEDNAQSLQDQRPVKKKRDEYEPEGRGGHFSKQQHFDKRVVASSEQHKHDRVPERKVTYKRPKNSKHSFERDDFFDGGGNPRKKFFNGAKFDKGDQKKRKFEDRTRRIEDRGFRRRFK